MNKLKIIVNNSYCEIKGDIDPEIENSIHNVLTTHNNIEMELASLFYKIKMLKKFGLKPKKDETPKENAARVKETISKTSKDIQKLKDSEFVYWYQDRKFPTGHLNIVKDLLEALKCDYILDNKRKKPKRSLKLPWKQEYKPRYYQQDMIDLGLSECRGVFESAVGTGKSLVMEYLIKEVSTVSLVVVPSKGLKEQIYNGLEKVFGSRYVQKIEGAQVRKAKRLKPIRVVTIQTIAALQKSGDLHLLMEDIQALFVDEIHHAGSESYTNALPYMDHIFWRFGFTGTFLRNDSKSLDMWGFLSNVLYRYKASQAIQDGFLTPVEINYYEIEGIQKNKYQKEYEANYCGNPSLMSKIYGIINGANPEDQILILVSRKDKSGAILHEYLKSQDIDNTYISGDNTSETIRECIKDFNSKKIKIMIGSNVIGEGIDIRSSDHLIMAQGGKSEIVIVQAVGRLVRLFEGKKVGYVHDFNFLNTKYLEKHFSMRLNIYERNFDPEIIGNQL